MANDMTCPRCNAALSPAQYEGIEIDRCGTCGGVWLDAGEIGPIISTTEETFSATTIAAALGAGRPGVPEGERRSVEKCPKCATALLPQNYNYSSGIIIDLCPKGHGLWFDRSELEHVQVHMEHWDKKKAAEGAAWAAKANLAKQAGERSLEASRKRVAEITSGPIQKMLMKIVDKLKG